jgi:hypothetical protein
MTADIEKGKWSQAELVKSDVGMPRFHSYSGMRGIICHGHVNAQ